VKVMFSLGYYFAKPALMALPEVTMMGLTNPSRVAV